MGTWGTNIYDNDRSADYLIMKMEKLINDIRHQIRWQLRLNAGFSESMIFMCDIDLLILLCEQRGLYLHLPELKEVQRWKRVYMDIWESTVDDADPTEEYRKGREQVLNNTFNRLIRLVKKRDKENKE